MTLKHFKCTFSNTIVGVRTLVRISMYLGSKHSDNSVIYLLNETFIGLNGIVLYSKFL